MEGEIFQAIRPEVVRKTFQAMIPIIIKLISIALVSNCLFPFGYDMIHCFVLGFKRCGCPKFCQLDRARVNQK